jgi:hypothetical protein
MNTMNEMDMEVTVQYLDNARFHVGNAWAEGYWIGRAIEHAEQNALDHDWLIEQFEVHGLDTAVVAIPRGDEVDPRNN